MELARTTKRPSKRIGLEQERERATDHGLGGKRRWRGHENGSNDGRGYAGKGWLILAREIA
jgi:hypothetical protein